MNYGEFFERVTGFPPYPYQSALVTGEWPTLLDIPTGLGKTAAAILAWLWRRLQNDETTGRRLVYCLPMRTLVEQTCTSARTWCKRAESMFAERDLSAPSVHMLMGGSLDMNWDTKPEHPAILIGTQDMLLSRALNRGYGMSRYRWPMHFGLLNNDCLWLFDETQLMGVGVETSAQLQGLRGKLGTIAPVRSLWMSATLGSAQLSTFDHKEPADGWSKHSLTDADRAHERVLERIGARKSIGPADGLDSLSKDTRKTFARQVAERVVAAHTERGGLTLVISNRVQRAQNIYKAVCSLLSKAGESLDGAALIHSRFRPADRKRHQGLLDPEQSDDRIIIATQAIEAGVDVSARTMFTELAPWPSLVQRFGRCNRYGEQDDAAIFWLDIASGDRDDLALPYATDDLNEARGLLESLAAAGADAGPATLNAVDYTPPTIIRPVLRRRDMRELFDTTPDLCGNDIDVSMFVRDSEDNDCQLYWREVDEDAPPSSSIEPIRDELCRVSVKATGEFLGKLRKKRQSASANKRAGLRAWTWDALDDRWVDAERPRPGMQILVACPAGGYDDALGWTGTVGGKKPVSDISDSVSKSGARSVESMGGDPDSTSRWVALRAHLGHVRDEARALATSMKLGHEWRDVVAVAGRWHDVGKAHEVFQDKLLAPTRTGQADAPDGPGPWAKSNHRIAAHSDRPHFRHELASALAYMHWHKDGTNDDLIAYLIAAHHGKVRLSIRSLPAEKRPDRPDDGPDTLYARGVWDGDVIPELVMPEGDILDATRLDLGCMHLGAGSWLERMLALRDRDDLGPFRLTLLESIVRVADWRASSKEQSGGYNDV